MVIINNKVVSDWVGYESTFINKVSDFKMFRLACFRKCVSYLLITFIMLELEWTFCFKD